jgi:sugar phosphate isomerase/epimerase
MTTRPCDGAGAAPSDTTPARDAGATAGGRGPTRPGPLCLFSKHLPSMRPGALARAIKSIGFEGVDLTVRPHGHVPPERVTEQLPAAVQDIRAEGLQVPLITTALVSADDPTARPILAAAGKLGVPLFKPGYFAYAFTDVRAELRQAGVRVRELADLGRQSGVQLAFHNHADCLGGSVWDAVSIVDPLDARWAGYYFDTRHAFAEGGQSGWKVAAHLVGPRVKAVSVKDFHWDRTAKGWEIRKVPLGQGMVDVTGILTILAQHGFLGPISLHLEHDIPGGDDAILEAAARDLAVLRKSLAAAYRTDTWNRTP